MLGLWDHPASYLTIIGEGGAPQVWVPDREGKDEGHPSRPLGDFDRTLSRSRQSGLCWLFVSTSGIVCPGIHCCWKMGGRVGAGA